MYYCLNFCVYFEVFYRKLLLKEAAGIGNKSTLGKPFTCDVGGKDLNM